ncbi:MAG: HAD-IA family hydrolase [Phycisphaerae bacterium]|jgi:beta-phosphoglucomutase-like phosphatase (HAD superfamily)
MNMNNLPKGIIFDMDGVLIDSEPFIIKAASQMFAEKGLKVQPQDFHPFTGMGENRFIGGVAEKYNFPIDIERGKERTYDIYLEIIKGNLKPLPGTGEFIAQCKKMNKKIAVASSADIRKVKGNLAEIKIPAETFDAVIAGGDVERKKPAPDIFLLAAEKIGLDPKDCLVIEDAPSGIKAGKAAGCKCLAIMSSFTPVQLDDADFFAPDLAHVPTEAVNW